MSIPIGDVRKGDRISIKDRQRTTRFYVVADEPRVKDDLLELKLRPLAGEQPTADVRGDVETGAEARNPLVPPAIESMMPRHQLEILLRIVRVEMDRQHLRGLRVTMPDGWVVEWL